MWKKNHWLTNQELLDAIAIGQITPGPLTVMNAFIGYKIYGLIGAVMAMVSSYLRCVIIVAKYYYDYRESVIVNSSFKGIRPSVIGLLAVVAISLGKASIVDPITFGLTIISFSVLAFTKIDPTFVIIGAGVTGALFL